MISGSTLKKVSGGSQRLEQVLVNLISNAIKYSPDHNKIGVNLSSDDNHVYCAVVDGGIGIPAKHLRIFLNGITVRMKNIVIFQV